MSNASELAKHSMNSEQHMREDSEYSKLIMTNEPRIDEVDIQSRANTRCKSFIWWLKAFLCCIVSIAFLLIFLKWGVPFTLQKVFAIPGESWLLRSLFVIEGYVLVCIEDLVRFSSRTDDVGVSSPYFSLDSCCPICGIVEMVIEPRESRCVTLSLNHAASRKIDFLPDHGKKKQFEQVTSAPLTWKLKWFSEDAVLKFVSLIKAIHLGVNMSPLPVRCVS